jgi:NarL family two-component system response regulator LiaR
MKRMMSSPIRVLIVDDHEIVRKGIRAFLATKRDIQVIAEAGDGIEAVKLAQAYHPDVILMDLVMPKMDGIQAIREITSRLPGTRVVVLTSFAADEQVFPAIKAGALGYLLKDSGPQELVQAIRQVYSGESSLDPSVARKVIMELSKPSQKPLTPDPLTQRELEILRLVAQGKSNKEIAEQLIIAEETAHTHMSNILNKLHLASRTQAALYALKEGIASVDDIPDTEIK